MPSDQRPGIPRVCEADFAEYCLMFKDLTTAAGKALPLSSAAQLLNELWLKGYRRS